MEKMVKRIWGHAVSDEAWEEFLQKCRDNPDNTETSIYAIEEGTIKVFTSKSFLEPAYKIMRLDPKLYRGQNDTLIIATDTHGPEEIPEWIYYACANHRDLQKMAINRYREELDKLQELIKFLKNNRRSEEFLQQCEERRDKLIAGKDNLFDLNLSEPEEKE